MNLWQFNIFCKVIELKSFSKAGKAINITQPTISSHIKDIENSFGCRLIDRLPKEVRPTKAGEILYNYARRIIALNNEAKIAISQFLGKISGDLTIGGSTIPGTYILPKIIGDFKIKYPEVNLSIMIGDTQTIIHDIKNGVLELGIVGALPNHKYISYFKLTDDKMCLIVPAKHKWSDKKTIPLTLLPKEPFITREFGSGTLKSLNNILIKQNLTIDKFNVVARMGNTEAVKQGIKNGVGISIISTLAVSDELQAGIFKAIDIESINLIRPFYLIKHKHRTISPLNNIFEEYLKGVFDTKSI